jgi:hypothetical protein
VLSSILPNPDANFLFQNRFAYGIVGAMPRKKKNAAADPKLETKPPEKDPAAVSLGRRGGLKAAGKGGKAIAASRTSAERSEAARKAVNARWARWREERAG